MELRYVKGNLFDVAPQGSYLAHACNTQGSWGAGIAKTFLKNYPEDFTEYSVYCDAEDIIGTTLITKNKIICLHTSTFYGKKVNTGAQILVNTFNALEDLSAQLPAKASVYSNKFNSGLFNVPWEHTEYILEEFLKNRSDISWVVCEV